ncbi:hypothetical protein LK533_05995 [Sphingomonas sp. PL-96]|uniref:hypothetical protein n=1 Tax=Sphingomonas sp. PL-96 TaxID=2887201 RepID=UPI001E357F3A|nr:hypothetical protein [Sphingomonas sp. PL-96]MCC2976224.1 hypothetical protein [Sphingomonas sp. PL-96]
MSNDPPSPAPVPVKVARPAPFTAGDYLCLRRQAAGLTIAQVVGRLSFGPSPLAEKLIAAAERNDRPLTDNGLEQLFAIFQFDPFVYRCLRDGIPSGRICRGCGCSWNDACIVGGIPCSWTGRRGDGEDCCTRCTGEIAEDGTRTTLLAFIELAAGNAAEPIPVLIDRLGDRLREVTGRFQGVHAIQIADEVGETEDMRGLAIAVLEHARPGLPHTRTLRFVPAAALDLGGAL